MPQRRQNLSTEWQKPHRYDYVLMWCAEMVYLDEMVPDVCDLFYSIFFITFKTNRLTWNNSIKILHIFHSQTRAMEFSNAQKLYWCFLIWSTDTCTNTFFPCGHTCSASYCHYLVSTHFLVFFLIFSLNLLKPNCQSERSVNSKSGIRPYFIHIQSHTQAYSLSLCLRVYNRAS